MTAEEKGKGQKEESLIDLTVLYVEDEPIPRERLAAILRRRIREVHLAGDGLEGLETCRRIRPDMVITDIRMPRMDGLAMIEAIKREAAATQVIVTSAFNDTDLLLRAIELGIDGYILKPVESQLLFSVINRCSEIVGLREELKQREQEQEQLITELRQALAEVKTLQGIMPICASCKKIRDDNGYWTQVESYISRHSELLFTHSICPDCAKELYPEFYDKICGKQNSEKLE